MTCRPARITALVLALLALPALAFAASLTLDWQDNASTEQRQHVERRLGPDTPGNTNTWGEIATVGANVVTYTDATAVDGQYYCFRLRAWNEAGFSAYSNIACPGPPTGPGNLRIR